MTKRATRRGLRSIFARVAASMLVAGIVAVGTASAITYTLMSREREADLSAVAVSQTLHMRDRLAARLELAREQLRGAMESAARGEVTDTAPLSSGAIRALACARGRDVLLTVATSRDADELLQSVQRGAERRPYEIARAGLILITIRAAELAAWAIVDVSDIAAPPAQWDARLVASETGATDTMGVLAHRERDARGEEWFAARARVVPGLTVQVRAPVAPARAASSALSLRIVRLSLVSLIPLTLLAWLLSRAVTSPIRSLARVVADGSGASLQIPDLPNDEIGDLGDAIRGLSERIARDDRARDAQISFLSETVSVRGGDDVLSALRRALGGIDAAAAWEVFDLRPSALADGMQPSARHAEIRRAIVDAMPPVSSDELSAGVCDVDVNGGLRVIAIQASGVRFGLVVGPRGDSQRERQVELLARSAALVLREFEAARAANRAEKLAVLGRLAAGVAHEMRTPLAYILANLRTLENEATGPTRDALTDTRQGAERLVGIVQDLSAHSRGGLERTVGPVDLAALARETVKVALARHPLGRVAVEGDEAVWAKCDRDRVGQGLLNLLVNALYATRSVDDGRVTIRVRTAGEIAAIDVEDNGGGIPAAARGSLFEAFVTTKEHDGTGLGLYLTRTFARASHGDVVLARTGVDGTVFCMTVPRCEPAVPTLPTDEQPSVAPVAAVPPTSADQRTEPQDAPKLEATRPHGASSTKPTLPDLLVVDDDPAVVRAMTRWLRGRANVVGSSDPREGLELAKTRPFSVILCDQNMPHMTGGQFVLALRAHDATLADRVVIVTGSSGHRTIEDARVLTKPLDPRQLQEILDAAT